MIVDAPQDGQENSIDVSNIMQTTQFFVDDDKISRKKAKRRPDELPSFIQDGREKRKPKVNVNR